MKILFLSSEVAPFAKTGGLADVVGSLPRSLKGFGVDVSIALPYYREVAQGKFPTRKIIEGLKVPLGRGNYRTSIFEIISDREVPVYLFEREDLFDRPHLYGDFRGDYYDNLARFTFFSQAVLKFMEESNLRPDIVHCHDWQTGLVPALIRGPYSASQWIGGVKSVFTIHNIGYQGIFPAEDFYITGLPMSDFFHPDGIEFWGNFSLLKAGLMYSDAITTVSPKYAREITTSEYGMGMEDILRSRKTALSGILNGVDYGMWNPSVDKHIVAKYSEKNTEGKSRCKESILQEMNLSQHIMRRPLLCAVSRLDFQKGVDLIAKVMDELMKMDVGVIIFGTGKSEIEDEILRVAKGNERRIAVKIGFDESFAHRIIAGADLFLIPSRYEPCGLTQMYALKYGTVPVVRATGGLDDTIIKYNPNTDEGNGFKFNTFGPEPFLEAIKLAVDLYGCEDKWKNIMMRGMEADFSWERSARKYLKMYGSTLKKQKSRK